jgi:hypothetical protein
MIKKDCPKFGLNEAVPCKTPIPEDYFLPVYERLKNGQEWEPTGVWHISCRTEVIRRFDSEACGCRIGYFILTRNLDWQEYFDSMQEGRLDYD